jgi:hypothetical protein
MILLYFVCLPNPIIFLVLLAVGVLIVVDSSIAIVGDPAIIGVACSIVSDITNGKYKLIKWDKQERRYYPIEINLYEKGKIDD